jgi:hypothetical protein
MTVSLLTGAAIVVRAWTWCYTLWLPLEVQACRRAEIFSDVWEYVHAPGSLHSPVDAAARLLVRVFLGMPDDIWWCCEQGHIAQVPLTRSTAPVMGALLSTTIFALWTVGPSVDPARALRVDVDRSGWVVIRGEATRVSLVPAAAVRLTNTSDLALGEIQVNALFGAPTSGVATYGFAFHWAIDRGGLAPGGTSTLILRPFLGASPAERTTAPVGVPLALPESRVRLFVKYHGAWTWLGDYPIASQLIAL